MIYEVTQFGLPKNIAAGVTEALRQMQPGDTLHFPKGEYHFTKIIAKVCWYTPAIQTAFSGRKRPLAFCCRIKSS